MAEDTPLTEASLPGTAARGRFKGKVAIVTGGASGKLYNRATICIFSQWLAMQFSQLNKLASCVSGVGLSHIAS